MASPNSTSASANDTSESPTNMQDSQVQSASSHRDWCAIISTSVVSCGLCTIGFALIAFNDTSTGLVLLFVGGSIVTLAVCAAIGKYKAQNKKELHDRPPSYRVSWRRSFLRRVKRANNQNGEEPPLQPSGRLPSSNNVLSLSSSSLVTFVESASGHAPHIRQTQSLDNIVDPPRYEDAVIYIDEATKRKLKSDLCLPSSNQF